MRGYAQCKACSNVVRARRDKINRRLIAFAKAILVIDRRFVEINAEQAGIKEWQKDALLNKQMLFNRLGSGLSPETRPAHLGPDTLSDEEVFRQAQRSLIRLDDEYNKLTDEWAILTDRRSQLVDSMADIKI
jgi:hypothetical protein